ncbi:MAG TPA: glutamate racemase [Ferruginibacter sp.]|nr:glutamate racemase [Ferruginibacter sp.]
MSNGPIGVFDSGYGGLTVLKEIAAKLPQYDYIYLGDNARAPYGTRSFDTVYQYTLQSVQWFFSQGCQLVILACNTASAKALRTIQQNDLANTPLGDGGRRVLGVIRPTSEVIGNFSKTKTVGVLGTTGTIQSQSYLIEIEKFFPGCRVFQEACPMWVPLVENNEHNSKGADYFIEKHINNLLTQSGEIDTILLACTHYPLLMEKIQQFVPGGCAVIPQGKIVADSLAVYLQRHPEMETQCSKGGQRQFYTTDSAEDFDSKAAIFYGAPVKSTHLAL